MNRFDITDWELSKTIIFDRNRKFLFDFWKVIFKQLKILLLYFIAYHFQIDDQSNRINQIVEIVLRFFMTIMNDFIEWSELLSRIQRHINNSVSVTIEKTLNETTYDFTSIQIFDLWKSFAEIVVVVVDNSSSTIRRHLMRISMSTFRFSLVFE